MKTFETWFKEYHDGRIATVRGTAKDAWRAALEWVKREAIDSGEGGYINRIIINRELEGD